MLRHESIFTVEFVSAVFEYARESLTEIRALSYVSSTRVLKFRQSGFHKICLIIDTAKSKIQFQVFLFLSLLVHYFEGKMTNTVIN